MGRLPYVLPAEDTDESAGAGDANWTTPVGTNGWGASGARFRKLADGRVVFRGNLTTGTGGASAFTLPVGYRPGVTVYFPVVQDGGTFGWVSITAAGDLIPQGSTGKFLDAVAFFAEA